VLTGGLDVRGIEHATPSMEFGATQVLGSTGCNRFSGPYAVDGDGMKLGQPATTQMACPPPGDEIERAFVRALDKVRYWQASAEELVLSDGDRKQLLVFAVASLEGSWEATSLYTGDAIKSAIVGTRVTADFAASGKLTGSAGCNPYTATYTAQRGAITVEQPQAEGKTCNEPTGIMEQESDYLAALTTARRYEVAGSTLTLLREGGAIAVTYIRR
jgi:heat shock protein HslJ